MEHGLYPQLLALLHSMWWPFVRIMALLSFAPVFGEVSMPTRVKALLAMVLAIVMLPTVAAPTDIDVFSLRSLVLTVEQLAVGATLGIALQFATAVVSVLGFIVSSQTGLSMAAMNDPINGQSSDALSAMLGVLGILVFFAIDAHLLVVGVVAASFKAWPIGQAIASIHIQTVAFNVGWVFAAAFLLATPVVFSALVVQLGFGFLARISPSLNIFSLGFSVVTLFGLSMLVFVMRFLPEHYIHMTQRTLDLIAAMMRSHV
ncbi:MAG TPA: flagellar biosynthetic protein FliR [Rhizobacter sp.]|nr:flagellar biosynthetic protein FliR [Rhizobacter sp.]